MKPAIVKYFVSGQVEANGTEIGEVHQIRMTSRGYEYGVNDRKQYRDVGVLDINERQAPGTGKSHYGWVPVPTGLGYTHSERTHHQSVTKSDYIELVAAFGAFVNKGDAVTAVANASGFKPVR